MTRLPILAGSLAAFALIESAPGATIYSNLQDITIPLSFTGVYLDVDNGSINGAEFAGWDINLFFGGTGLANSAAFQPARTGTGNTDSVLHLSVGATVDGSQLFSSGFGGSHTHLGTQFTDGQEGYLGFKFTKNNAAGPYFGWMRVLLTGNTGGATIKDWAYDDGGSLMVAGRVLQNAAVGNAQLVTLSPGANESFTLGSALTDTSGNINSLLKTGLGTVALGTANTYSGGTTVSGGILTVNSDNALGAVAGGVTIANDATLQLGAAITSNRTFTLGAGGGKIDTNGNSVTLGASSSVGGSTLTKTGSGTLTINGSQSYATLNANSGITIVSTPLGTGSSTVNALADVTFGEDQLLANLTIGAGAVVTMGNPPPAPVTLNGFDGPFAAVQVPEPCGISFLVLGAFELLGRRYRTNRRAS